MNFRKTAAVAILAVGICLVAGAADAQVVGLIRHAY